MIYIDQILDLINLRTFVAVSGVYVLIFRKRCTNIQHITILKHACDPLIPIETCTRTFPVVATYKEHWYWVTAWVYLTLPQIHEAAIIISYNENELCDQDRELNRKHFLKGIYMFEATREKTNNIKMLFNSLKTMFPNSYRIRIC